MRAGSGRPLDANLEFAPLPLQSLHEIRRRSGPSNNRRFLNQLHADHLVLEMARRSATELSFLKELDHRLGIGLGVVDIKSNLVETPEEIARRIEQGVTILGPGRVKYVHPDCGFWMLKRSVADRKMAALVRGRDLFLGKQ
ncbi:MAG TPA: hypothetical protein VK633_00655 [Verrucomicrobiae bacterium]|nr:hypothetical protein [Verrucomicrobiae bacterium]